ncbi:hypothetical protein HGO34_11145 [Agrobacterium vitis]|nr:hypothetical protein [Allorhizobium sp. Av2]MCM2440269.1 hypothetical protein [Agrobacterium vitis]
MTEDASKKARYRRSMNVFARFLSVNAVFAGDEEHEKANHQSADRHDQHCQKLLCAHGFRPFNIFRANKCNATDAKMQMEHTSARFPFGPWPLLTVEITGAKPPTAKIAMATPLI